jgi:hypothetical protein
MPLAPLLSSPGDPERLLLLGLSGDEAVLELPDELVGLTLWKPLSAVRWS